MQLHPQRPCRVSGEKAWVKEDCEFIVRICHQVVQAIMNLVNRAMGVEMTKKLCLA